MLKLVSVQDSPWLNLKFVGLDPGTPKMVPVITAKYFGGSVSECLV